MAINAYNIKKWYKMLTGNSMFHVNQGVGKEFVKNELYGYFNDLTEKVKYNEYLNDQGVPIILDEHNNFIEFPVAIFQYGLGAYDLYLSTGEKSYLDKFEKCVIWAINNQERNGAWNNFYYIYPQNPYGAMCQGEGVSLLLRAFKIYGNEDYLIHARKALDFMLKSVEEGGTAKYVGDEIFLLEYTHLPVVLNGWIFAYFGLYDFLLVDNQIKYKEIFEKCTKTLLTYLNVFDCKYWSYYDMDKKIASPFYHDLHIAQMQILFEVTNVDEVLFYKERWRKDKNNPIFKSFAFIKKACQKILER